MAPSARWRRCFPASGERGVSPVIACLNRRKAGVQDEVVRSGVDVRFVTGMGTLDQSTGDTGTPSRSAAGSDPYARSSRPIWRDASRAVRTGVPVLSSLVNTSYEPVRLVDPNVKRWKLGGARLIDGLTTRHLTTHFHAISHAVKDSAIRRLGIGRSGSRSYRGGAMRNVSGSQARSGGEPLGGPSASGGHDRVVLNVGRREHQKGQRYLLEATASLAASYPGLVTLIAGREGHAAGELNQIATRAQLNGHVQFLGHRDDVPELLAAADLFVFPSLYEGLGGALIEAMALGPSHHRLGHPSASRGGGARWERAPGSRRQRSRAGHSHGADCCPTRPSWGGSAQRSRDLFLERFTLDRAVDRMADLFREVAGRGRRRAAA